MNGPQRDAEEEPGGAGNELDAPDDEPDGAGAAEAGADDDDAADDEPDDGAGAGTDDDDEAEAANDDTLIGHEWRAPAAGHAHAAGSGERAGRNATGRRAEAPSLLAYYSARVRENERRLQVAPKLRVLNKVEICDFQLGETPDEPRTGSHNASGHFTVSWIDRVTGETTIEAQNENLMDCERRPNYTIRLRAIGCNGLESNE